MIKNVEHYIAEQTPIMLAYVGADLKYKYVNESYARHFQKKKEDLVNKMTQRDLLGDAIYGQLVGHIEVALRGETASFQMESPLLSGEKRIYKVDYLPDIQDGVVAGFLVNGMDITPMKMLDLEFLTTYEIIKKQNELLKNFSHTIAHNLKSYANNLNAVLNMFLKADTDDRKHMTQEMLKEIADGIASTIGHITEIAKVQTNDKLPMEEIVVEDFLKRNIGVLALQLAMSQTEIVNNCPPGTTIYANPAFLDSIMQNLLGNAIKYRHPDRIPKIELGYDETMHKKVLSFKDNGLGIDLDKYGNKIFGIFQTFHKNPDAVGIGLYLTKYQVESMGGDIDVESKPGVGTKFKVSFKKR